MLKTVYDQDFFSLILPMLMLVGAIICSGLDGFYPFDQALTAQRSGGVNGFPACDELQDHHTERENV